MLSHGTRRVLRHIKPDKVRHYRNSSSRLFSSKSDGSVGDYFSSLRLKAANAITSNLPDEERNQLLDNILRNGGASSIDDEDDEPEEDPAVSYEPSIDEAIAATKIQEAERYEEKWEREKEELVAEAEKAARARIESDIEIQKRQIAFEQWKAELEAAKVQEEEVVSSDETTEAAEEVSEHPVLGPIVADLGYKRVHLASSVNLATIPIWKKQRIYRHGRSKNMANEKMKTLSMGLPGVIGIFEVNTMIDRARIGSSMQSFSHPVLFVGCLIPN